MYAKAMIGSVAMALGLCSNTSLAEVALKPMEVGRLIIVVCSAVSPATTAITARLFHLGHMQQAYARMRQPVSEETTC